MILTRSWLNEWIDLSDISTDELCKRLNSLGLEVDSVQELCAPLNVVVGRVISCEKHPNADKLNVCRVEVGAETKQIVCGAKNVVDATFVSVAMIGAKLPNGLEIKHRKIRGIESEGMICSSSELGLPSINDGIMILDESIGELEVGKEIGEYEIFNDAIIEIDLTPNRGDCLSIYGVARDLGAAFNKELKLPKRVDYKESIGIGKILSFAYDEIDGVNMHYKVAQIDNIKVPLSVDLRLAEIGQKIDNDLDKLLAYAMHESGVILNAYDFNFFGEEKAKLFLRQNEFVELLSEDEVASKVGVCYNKASKPNSNKVILEASYVNPNKIVPIVATNEVEPDSYYHRTSRGSEPDVDFGMDILVKLLSECSHSTICSGSSTYYAKAQKKSISINLKDIEKLIGQEIDKSEVSSILKHLGFSIQNLDGDRFGVIVPAFRHDITNIEDVTEEILRIIGIDNIAPKKLKFFEHNRVNESLSRHRFKRMLKQKAVANGYYEVVTYLFSENAKLQKYGFKTVQKELSILNPITSEMDGLRTTMLLNLLEAVQRNINYGKKRVQLFEIGTVFDENRVEKEQISFVFSGCVSDDNVSNSGKPKDVDLISFINSIASIIGDFELRQITVKNGLIHPYQSGDIIIQGKRVGYLSKLHPNTEFEIPTTYIATIDVEPLIPAKKEARAISNFQAVTRDLSVLIPKDVTFEAIKEILDTIEIENLRSYYAVDIYEDESLQNQKSLTLRFVIQSDEKTLQDEDLNPIMDQILKVLEDKAKAKLR